MFYFVVSRALLIKIDIFCFFRAKNSVLNKFLIFKYWLIFKKMNLSELNIKLSQLKAL
jgi:hypothetical protein